MKTAMNSAKRRICALRDGRGGSGAERIASAQSEAGAASRIGSTPAKFARAFVNWGAEGRERTLQAWEKWLNQTPSSVLGVDFYAQSTWQDFSGLAGCRASGKTQSGAKRGLVGSADGERHRACRCRQRTARFRVRSRREGDCRRPAKSRHPARLGDEPGRTSPWFARGQETDYIEAFRRVVESSGGTRTASIRLVPGMGAAGTQRRSRLSRRRRGRLHRSRRL